MARIPRTIHSFFRFTFIENQRRENYGNRILTLGPKELKRVSMGFEEELFEISDEKMKLEVPGDVNFNIHRVSTIGPGNELTHGIEFLQTQVWLTPPGPISVDVNPSLYFPGLTRFAVCLRTKINRPVQFEGVYYLSWTSYLEVDDE